MANKMYPQVYDTKTMPSLIDPVNQIFSLYILIYLVNLY